MLTSPITLAIILAIIIVPGMAIQYIPNMMARVNYCSIESGRLMQNAAPSPGLLRTEILPPCASMIVLHILSPNP